MFGFEERLGGRCLASRSVLEGGVWLRGASWRAVFGLEVCLGGQCFLRGASWKAVFIATDARDPVWEVALSRCREISEWHIWHRKLCRVLFPALLTAW